MMKVYFEPIDKYTLEYILSHRIDRHVVDMDRSKYRQIILSNPTQFHTMIINNKVIGVVGFIAEWEGLAGYLILTDNYKKYARIWLKEAKKHLAIIDAPIFFVKHHDIEYINKWYKIMGFELDVDNNIWIRRR